MDPRAASAQHADLLDKIAQTSHALPALAAHSLLLADLSDQLRASQSRLLALEARRAADLRDVEKYRDSTPRRILHRAVGRGAEHDERAAREEADYLAVLADAQHEQAVASSLRQRCDEAARTRDDLEGQVQLYNAAQRELDALHSAIFAGVPRGRFPAVDDRAMESDSALMGYHEARSGMDALDEVDGLLAAAVAEAARADKHMELAAEHWSGSCLRDANAAVAAAEGLVRKAQRLSPADAWGMPAIRRSAMYSFHMYDSRGADAFHREVRMGQLDLRVFVTAVEGYRTDVRDRREAFAPELSQREDELERTRLELQKARRLVFDELVMSGRTE